MDSYLVQASPMQYTFILIIAVLLLLIVSINFMNLSTARYVTRANETGLRKVIGAHRFQLIRQFLGESIFMSLLSLPAAIIIYELLRPAFSALTGDKIDISLWNSPVTLLFVIGVTILLGIFAGSYPAFFLSSFEPVQVLKGKLLSGKRSGRFRKILVITQFAFSIILIITTLFMQKQYYHFFNVNLGFDRNNIIAIDITGKDRADLENMKKELLRNPDIRAVSTSADLPGFWDTKSQVLPEGVPENEIWTFNTYGIDYNFIEMLDIKTVQGRSFSRDYTDADNYIINETAAHQLQWEDPIGKQITVGNKKGTVIGVTRNFHFKHIHYPIAPALLYLEPENQSYVLVKYSSSANFPNVLKYIKEQWQSIESNLPFEYITLNNHFHDIYRGTRIGYEIIGSVGFVAIFFCFLGLLGLASYSAERRTKEIGIRKVLGASVSGIIRLIHKEFLILVAISNIVAMPAAYFISINLIRYLSVYTITISLDIFILTAVLTLFTTIMAVTSQTLKAARANPAEALRFE